MVLVGGQDGKIGCSGFRLAYFYLEEVLWWSVDLLEALRAGIGHCLHGGDGGWVVLLIMRDRYGDGRGGRW